MEVDTKVSTFTFLSQKTIICCSIYYHGQGAVSIIQNAQKSRRRFMNFDVEKIRGCKKESEYGNGDIAEFDYDELHRLIAVRYGLDDPSVEYEYDNLHNITRVRNNELEEESNVVLDSIGRTQLYSRRSYGTSTPIYEYQLSYDTMNNVSAVVEKMGNQTWTTGYAFDKDNRSIEVQIGKGAGATHSLKHSYDAFGRVANQKWFTGSGTTATITSTYTYEAPATGYTTAVIASYKNQFTGYNKTTNYTYDSKGNILSKAFKNGTTTQYTNRYVYDGANQLTRENNQEAGKTWTYLYDASGNIRQKKEYTYTTGTLGTPIKTIVYEYNDTQGWGELLTSYDGNAITYDGIGNPLSDGEWEYTWQKGRQLAGMSKAGMEIEYTYNENGIRVGKTVNGELAASYIVNGSKVVHETIDGHEMHYRYGDGGYLLSVNIDGVEYFYIRNAQDDVIAIVNPVNGTKAEYSYDAWGNLLSIIGDQTIGELNPYRYRGYRYDVETGLYYLQNRYYNPKVGRFLNADGMVMTGGSLLDSNMFSYCINNPMSFVDPTGRAHATPDSGTGSALKWPQTEEAAKRAYEKQQEEKKANTYMPSSVQKSENTNDPKTSVVTSIESQMRKETLNDGRERVAGIYQSSNGTYYAGKVLTGQHDNVILEYLVIASTPTYDLLTGFVHTHPLCSCHSSDVFSDGDRYVAFVYDDMYLVAPSGEIYVINRRDVLDGTDKRRVK